MKKRIIVSLFFIVGITSILLILAIFKLYTEAEKVQRSIFVNEVLTAGDELVERIDALIKNDTLPESQTDSVNNQLPDTTAVVSVQRARRFLLDTASFDPIGIIQTVIFVKENNSRVVEDDTTYFSDAYRKMFPLNNDPWSPKNAKGNVSSMVANMDANLVEMDSTTLQLLSVENLSRLIKACLAEENIDARFDFALYNAFTTDFAILFLPIEGLYAEILSIPGLQDRVQREFHVMIAGPATLASLLNSLQMGFRTLAIEKKSSEVWHVLGEVKTEYGKFGIVLDTVKKKLTSASNEIDNAFTRHRAMGRKLRGVEAVETDDTGLIESSSEGEE